MGTENLNQEEAKKKLKELVEGIKVGMMVTGLTKEPFNAIPMTTKKVDEEGNIWFLSSKKSEHNQNITSNNKVELLYSDPSDMEFVSISGTAAISTEKSILEELYDKTTDTWFVGEDDPNLSAIKFIPDEAYYWDTKSNKYQALFKMGIAAITGNEKDIGQKGKLNL